MTDEYEERGLFKELVLITFLVCGWLASKWDQLRNSEAFWWSWSALFLAVAVYCLLKLL